MTKLIVPQWPMPGSVAACSSTRIGGVSLPPYDSLNLGAHCGDNLQDLSLIHILQPKVIQCDIHGANGLAFSADRRWMYTSDTPNAVIYRTPLDEQGEPGRREVFRRFQPGEGIPDGAAIDVEGCYWSAMFDGWRIARFSPLGEELESYPMPVRCPTMVCFGGADMKTLYITTRCV